MLRGMGEDAFVCTKSSLDADEPLIGSASRVDVWLLLEHHGRWESKALEGWPESGAVKAPLEAFLEGRDERRFQFVRRGDRGSTRAVMVVDARTSRGRRAEVSSYADITLELLEGLHAGTAGVPITEPLYLVCTHGKRDRCCARYGVPVFHAVEAAAPGRAFMTTHLGGHRFAATMAVLPGGFCYGRIAPERASEIVAAHDAGRVADLALYRGRSIYEPEIQAAEAALRAREGLRAEDAVSLVDTSPIVFETAAGRRALTVTVRPGDRLIKGSCSKEKQKPATLFDVA